MPLRCSLKQKGLENILLSMHISGSKGSEKTAYALRLLESVGIDGETARLGRGIPTIEKSKCCCPG